MMADLTFTITVPEAKAAAFVEGFLGYAPKGTGFDGTDEQWVQHMLEWYVRNGYATGVRNNAADTADVDGDILEPPRSP